MKNFFILKKSQLKKGDIILIDGRKVLNKKFNKVIPGIIKIFTGSNYTHALMYIDHNRYIDATNSGVHFHNIDKLFFTHEKNSVKVLRPLITEEVAKRISIQIQLLHGSLYSKKKAMNSITPLKIKNKESEFFCSELIASVFKKEGIFLLKTNTDKVTPKMLIESEILEDIKTINFDIVTESFTQKEIKNIDEQISCTNNLKKLIFKKTQEDIPYLESLKNAISIQKFDKEVAEALEESNYLNMYKKQLEKELKEYLDTNKTKEELKSYLSFLFFEIKRQEKRCLEIEELAMNSLCNKHGKVTILFSEHFKKIFSDYLNNYNKIKEKLEKEYKEIFRVEINMEI